MATAMAPRPLSVVTLPPNHSTLQWHPTMAPNNAPRPLPQSWSSPYPPTIAHYNGTLRCHPAMAPWCHVQSAKVVRRPPPLVEVRTPIAIAIREKTWMKMYLYFLTQKISMTVFPAIVMVSFWGVQNPFFWIATLIGDSIRQLSIPSLEVTNNLCHAQKKLTIAELPGCFFDINLATWKMLLFRAARFTWPNLGPSS